jgi:MFS family permease
VTQPAAIQAAPDSIAYPRRAYAWYVVILLMVAYAVSILDRIGLGLLVQPIEADLHISDGRLGLLQGAAFAVFYSLLGLPLGFLADRASRRNLIACGIAVWSGATILCGASSGFWGLFAARLGVGAGEATISPAGLSLLTDYFPPASRPKAYGVYSLGTAFGVATSYLFGAAAIGYAGALQRIYPAWLAGIAAWKIVFFMIGAPGLLVALAFTLTVGEPVRRERAGISAAITLTPLLRLLARRRGVYGGMIAWGICNAISVYALLGWFPTVMIRVHGWTAAQTGHVLGAYGIPCAVFSCLSGGWSVAWLQQRGRADAPILIAIGASVWVTLAGIIASLATTPGMAVAAYCVLSLATNNAGIALLTALNKITPNELRGQVLALSSMATGIVSVSLGPFAVGTLSDHVFTGPTGIGASVATVLAVSGGLGVVILAGIRGRFDRLMGQKAVLF